MLKSLLVDFSRYKITENDSGRRLDRVLRKFLPDIPLSAIYRLLRKGAIRLDGKKAAPGTICPLSSVIEIESQIAAETCQARRTSAAEEDCSGSRAEAFIKEITVFETPDLLFLNKPSGIAVHGEHSLCSILPRSEDEAASLSFRAGALHRLDKSTTGLIAFSKTLAGAKWFSKAVREREIVKLYAGIVETKGKTPRSECWIDHSETGSETFSENHRGTEPLSTGKTMETRFFPFAFSESLALAVFSLSTGRKHQIRKQAAMRSMPLLGDTLYGGSRHSGGYFLHAGFMAFPEERLEGLSECLEAPFPERFLHAADAFFGKSKKHLADMFRRVYTSS